MAFSFIGATTVNSFDFSSQKIVQKQLADDVLKASVDLNKLQTFDNGQINGFFLANIPSNYDYKLELNFYQLGSNSKFNLISPLVYGNTTTDLNNVTYIESKKVFLTFYNNDINKYASAKLRVWVR